ncbi:MAG TPA: hypothetical protein VER39_05615 [Nocardioidaceae bacterium]|nr:hypothetical protein [Nocardioidaceae bacterium]
MQRRSGRRGVDLRQAAMIQRLAWVTTASARGTDDDEPPAVEALRSAGVTVEVVDWDDRTADWASYDRVLLRSAWDYAERLGEFLAWLATVDRVTDLRNPAQMVRWSLDKHYLAELAAAGVPVTPTMFVEPGAQPVLPDGEVVVKPAVGAGSRDAASYGPEQRDQARAHVHRLLAQDRSVLVQPLLASVAVDGEWPLLFFGGRYSHAASKRVALPRAGVIDELFAPETLAEHQPDQTQLEVAHAAMEVVASRFGTPTYARVDLVHDDEGSPVVLELELVEPSLFLAQAGPRAVDLLVEAATADGAE